MLMWVVYKEAEGNCWYWTGERNDWSAKYVRAACWQDRRDAHAAAATLRFANREFYGESFDCGTVLVDVPPANPSQIIPVDGEIEMKRVAGRSR